MLFGRSLFAGVLVAGLVSATGAAACSTSASGVANVLFCAKGAGVCSAVSSAKGLRIAVASNVTITCRATVGAKANVKFYLSGIASAVAVCNGKALGKFFLAGQAQSRAQLEAALYRRVRMGPQPPARAEAIGGAEAFSYVYAFGTAAAARASAFGTTYYVGRGVGASEALAVAYALRTIGVRQNGTAVAVASAAAINIAGAIADGYALATLLGDAAVKRDGHREFECFGFANAKSLVLPATTVVYQPQVAAAKAVIAATVVQTRGAKGRGQTTAVGVGVGVVGQTAVQGSTAGNTAVANARALRAAFVKGAAACKAAVAGNVKWLASARIAAKAFASLTSEVRFLVTGKPAVAIAVIAGNGDRFRVTGGAATCAAVAQGYNQVNDLILAPPSRTVRVLSSDRELITVSEPRLLAA